MSNYLQEGATDEQCSTNPIDKDELEEYCDEFYCWDCGGRRWKITCIDDLCHGQDECIHGDPPTPCWTCNRKGEHEDRNF